jgi:Family of unknown function (DUF6328)
MAEDEGDWDRRFIELLQELRVMQTGIQILFAFLLTLPFSNRFGLITNGQTITYVLTLVAAAAATAFLIAPVSFHRLTRTAVNKRRIVRTAARMSQAGLLMLLLAIGGAVYLVTDIVLNNGWARLICGVLGAVYVGLWYVLPLSERLSRARSARAHGR